MNGKRIFWALILCPVLASCVAAVAQGGTPLGGLLSFGRVDADPDKDYRIGEDNGPWMIMACSFSGEGADEQARELAYELRKHYKLEAYTHEVRFDFGDAEGRGIDPYGAPIKARYRRGGELEEIAVMVGNYPSVDDPQAQKILAKLKYSHPKCLEIDKRKRTSQSLAGWRMTQKQLQKLIGSEKRKKGPMGHAFVTTNPRLPKNFFAAPGLDKLVLDMNKHVTHSLLDCPGKYSVQVATFKGNVFIKPKEIREIESGKRVESKLAKAAKQAHDLTEALRMKGYEAYEFHDRYASVVTVGSFNSMGTPRADGRTEINPRIRAIMTTFGGQPMNGPTPQGVLPTHVKKLVGIPFDPQSIPIHVPKRSISREMTSSLF